MLGHNQQEVVLENRGEDQLSRREFLTLSSGVAAGVAGLTLGQRAVAAPRPKKKTPASLSPRQNLLFVFTDQQRYFPRWPAGFSLPGQSRLARHGVTFTHHYVSASMCTSSRAVMLTGLQTADNGMFDNIDCPYIKSLSPRTPTVGHLLRKAGYYTAYKGKWHLDRDFDVREPDKSLVDKMDRYGFSDFFSPGDGMAHTLGGYASDPLIAGSALSWLRQKGRALSDERKPWSLFVSLVNPHDIMYFNADAPDQNVQDTGKLLMHAARAPRNKAYRATWRSPAPQGLHQALNEPGRPSAHAEYARAWGYCLGNIPLAESNWSRFSDFYLNSIRQVDLQVAALLDELEALDLARNTVVVFTADHGEMGGNHGLRGKGPFAYEQAIHVPFHVVHPDVAGGQSCAALSSHIDVVPTLLSLAGVKPGEVGTLAERELPGKDLSSVIAAPKAADVHAVRDQALFTYSGIATNDGEMIRIIAEAKAAGKDPKAAVKAAGYRPNLKNRGSLRTVVDGRYKFSRYFSPTERNKPNTLDELYASNDVELYDLKTDAAEMKNLAADRAKHGELVATMSRKLETAIQAEIGKDDGREMPELPGIDWTLERVDL